MIVEYSPEAAKHSPYEPINGLNFNVFQSVRNWHVFWLAFYFVNLFFNQVKFS